MSALRSRLREHRDRHGLSQQALGDLVGVTRHAILGIEAGRRVPSTELALRLARALRCDVEDLFSLVGPGDLLDVGLAPAPSPSGGDGPGGGVRVALARIDGAWVGHRLAPDASVAADGVVRAFRGDRARVEALVDEARLARGTLIAGCAPLLGLLAGRVGERWADRRATWLPAGSGRSLELLDARLVHVAGLHAATVEGGDDNAAVIRRRFPDRRMLVVNLTRWRQGLVLPPGNPAAIRGATDLMRPGLRIARREPGAGAHEVLRRLLVRDGADPSGLVGPLAHGHADVARLVACGAADAGIAIESEAIAAGLAFVPLSDERFDLVVAAEHAERDPVSRLIDTLDDPAFRAEVAQLPGYDTDATGHATTLEAA